VPTRCAARILLALLAASCGTPVPRVIRDELAQSPPGVATVIVFTDFQCPFCRRTHAALASLVAAHEGRVRVVLRHVPLPRHPDARTAARAAVCTEGLPGRAPEAMAHALFTAPDLGEAACETLAVQHGASVAAYRACVADPATDARIDRDVAILDSLGGDGVPLLFVGTRRIDGAPSRPDLERSLRDALGD